MLFPWLKTSQRREIEPRNEIRASACLPERPRRRVFVTHPHGPSSLTFARVRISHNTLGIEVVTPRSGRSLIVKHLRTSNPSFLTLSESFPPPKRAHVFYISPRHPTACLSRKQPNSAFSTQWHIACSRFRATRRRPLDGTSWDGKCFTVW